MTLFTVDTTGIQNGDTLVWDATHSKFVVGPPTIAATAIAFPTGHTAAELPSTPADGSRAVVRVGSGVDTHQEVLRYNAGLNKWIGEVEYTLVTQGDRLGMDLGSRNQTQLEDWSPIDNPIPYRSANAVIAGPLNLSAAAFDAGTHTGTITVDDTTNATGHSFPFLAATTANIYFRIRDNYLIGQVGSATTLVNCGVVLGSRGTIPDGEWITQGFPGGWGFNVYDLTYAGDLFAAGLSLQEKIVGLINSAPGGRTVNHATEKKITVGAYWHQYDNGDGAIPNSLPLSGGLGVSNQLASLPNTGDVQQSGVERQFYMTEFTDAVSPTIAAPGNPVWKDWPLAAPTKRFLKPTIVGKMETGAFTSGSVLDLKLVVRWVAPGT